MVLLHCADLDLECTMFDENDLDALDEDTLHVTHHVTDCFYGGKCYSDISSDPIFFSIF